MPQSSDPGALFEAALGGDRGAIARLLSLIERGGESARQVGLQAVPLLCAREVPVPGAMPRVIRVMLHYHAAPDHAPAHVYLGDTQKLRSDLESAQ